jgi:hypothetical protein
MALEPMPCLPPGLFFVSLENLGFFPQKNEIKPLGQNLTLSRFPRTKESDTVAAGSEFVSDLKAGIQVAGYSSCDKRDVSHP